jgi:hypothetical protein
MLKRFASLALVLALVCTVGGGAVMAKAPTDPLPEPTDATGKEVKPNEKLRVGITKLLADTKAGKRALPEQPQIQPTKSNGLSKGKKIALGVGIAVVVVAIIVINHARNHLFDDFNLSGIAIR